MGNLTSFVEIFLSFTVNFFLIFFNNGKPHQNYNVSSSIIFQDSNKSNVYCYIFTLKSIFFQVKTIFGVRDLQESHVEVSTPLLHYVKLGVVVRQLLYYNCVLRNCTLSILHLSCVTHEPCCQNICPSYFKNASLYPFRHYKRQEK